MRINLGWLKAAETPDDSRQLEKSVLLWLTGVHLRYHPVLRLRLQVLGLFDSTQPTVFAPAGVGPVRQHPAYGACTCRCSACSAVGAGNRYL